MFEVFGECYMPGIISEEPLGPFPKRVREVGTGGDMYFRYWDLVSGCISRDELRTAALGTSVSSVVHHDNHHRCEHLALKYDVIHGDLR